MDILPTVLFSCSWVACRLFHLCLEDNLNMNNCSNYEVCTSKIEEVGYLYILPCICGIGIFSNSLILFVFSNSQFNSKMTSSTLTYLTALALADGLSCLFTLPETFIRCVDAVNKNVQQFYNFYEEYVYYPVLWSSCNNKCLDYTCPHSGKIHIC